MITGLVVVITLALAFASPFKYKATTKLLIIQDQEVNLDAYTAVKSAEKIGQNLTQIVSSTVFYGEVIKANPRLANEFPTDELKRRQAWQRDVTAAIVPETGVLEISAYNENRAVAAEIVSTVALNIIMHGDEYHGAGNKVSIKIIDDVIVGKYPARPNLIVNLIFAVVMGLALGFTYVVLRESAKAKRAITYMPKEGELEPETLEPEISEKGFHLHPHRNISDNWKIEE